MHFVKSVVVTAFVLFTTSAAFAQEFEPGVVEGDTSVSDIPYCKLPDGNADLLRKWMAGGVSPGYSASSEYDTDGSSQHSEEDEDG